jgi:hypothetical protein
MTDRVVLLYGRLYRWRDGRVLRGSLHLEPHAPDLAPGETIKADVLRPWWPTPCDAWLATMRAKDVAASRAIVEAKVAAEVSGAD